MGVGTGSFLRAKSEEQPNHCHLDQCFTKWSAHPTNANNEVKTSSECLIEQKAVS